MKILAIESSCDETAAAIVEDGRHTLGECVASQADLHSHFGGVVPEIASRKHVEAIIPVVQECLTRADCRPDELDAVAVTAGPGLVGALLVGVSAAKALASAWHKPLYAVHHIFGHVAANYLAHPEFNAPFICLVASGGHSHLLYCSDPLHFEILGRTRDDAAGEAFDKIARVLGLPYPGGPNIDKLAKTGDPLRYSFPHVKLDADSLDFSFSGLKTYAINRIHQAEQKGEAISRPDFAASFQHTIVESLVNHTLRAAERKSCRRIALAGGVAANSQLRERMREEVTEAGMDFYCPPLRLCTDNAEMIASAACFMAAGGAAAADHRLNAHPSWSIDEEI